jgi:hypothetical protein
MTCRCRVRRLYAFPWLDLARHCVLGGISGCGRRAQTVQGFVQTLACGEAHPRHTLGPRHALVPSLRRSQLPCTRHHRYVVGTLPSHTPVSPRVKPDVVVARVMCKRLHAAHGTRRTRLTSSTTTHDYCRASGTQRDDRIPAPAATSSRGCGAEPSTEIRFLLVQCALLRAASAAAISVVDPPPCGPPPL